MFVKEDTAAELAEEVLKGEELTENNKVIKHTRLITELALYTGESKHTWSKNLRALTDTLSFLLNRGCQVEVKRLGTFKVWKGSQQDVVVLRTRKEIKKRKSEEHEKQ